MTITVGMKFQPVHETIKWEPIRVTSVSESMVGNGTIIDLHDPNMPGSPGCCDKLADVVARIDSGEWIIVQ